MAKETFTHKTLNTHHFGGIDKLPETARYVGRPGPYGNPYSTESGKYTKEECVARHRIHLYRTLIEQRTYFDELKQELGGCDVACWCKQDRKTVACHGDNYLHVLAPWNKDRLYDRSIIFYLMEDLRRILTKLHDWIMQDLSTEDFLPLYICFGDMHLNVKYVIQFCRGKDIELSSLAFLIARIVVDLELAYQDNNHEVIEYRFNHVVWIGDQFISQGKSVAHEPVRPDIPLKRNKAGG